MNIIELTKDNFEDVIDNNELVFIDYWAEWCGPCKAFSPIYEEIAKQHQDIIFAKVNIEHEQELAAGFNVRSIPMLMVFKEQIVVFTESGLLPKNALQDLVEQAKKLDMTEVKKQIAQAEQQDQ